MPAIHENTDGEIGECERPDTIHRKGVCLLGACAKRARIARKPCKHSAQFFRKADASNGVRVRDDVHRLRIVHKCAGHPEKFQETIDDHASLRKQNGCTYEVLMKPGLIELTRIP